MSDQDMKHALSPVKATGFIIILCLGVWSGMDVSISIPSETAALAGDMATDPNGFYGIQWGENIADLENLTLVESGEHIREFEVKHGPPKLGEAMVRSLRFVTFDGQFARASIHYQGNQVHMQMLTYLQSLFGPTERTPGSMMRGLNQQFNWRGPNTEVNLTYEANYERGFVFIESRTLAARFNDTIPE